MAPKQGKKTSDIWAYFIDYGSSKAKCKFCPKVISFRGGSTFNLARHLRLIHLIDPYDSWKHHPASASVTSQAIPCPGDPTVSSLAVSEDVQTAMPSTSETIAVHIQNEDGKDNKKLTDDVDAHVQDTPTIAPRSSKTVSTRKRKKPEKARRLDTAALPMTSSGASNSAINDSTQHFGNMVAAKLRKYNETAQCAIQAAILGIFLDASRGCYNQSHLQPNYHPTNMHHTMDSQRNLQFTQPPSTCNLDIGPHTERSSSNLSHSHHSTTPTPQQSPATTPVQINSVKEEVEEDQYAL